MASSSSASPAIRRFESALLDAVAAFGEQLQRSADPVRRSAEGLLARLGFGRLDAGEPLPSEAVEALRRENERLRRAASRSDPRYDLNRHIAVRRLLKGEAPALPAPAFQEAARSGHELNRRFRRPKAR